VETKKQFAHFFPFGIGIAFQTRIKQNLKILLFKINFIYLFLDWFNVLIFKKLKIKNII
jgi:hypothetical protein